MVIGVGRNTPVHELPSEFHMRKVSSGVIKYKTIKGGETRRQDDCYSEYLFFKFQVSHVTKDEFVTRLILWVFSTTCKFGVVWHFLFHEF